MHTATNANLFVIQWRWSVHKQPETMTPWQTVMVRNKMYAILKHLLSPGRYYLFRVAAVNIHGTYGFSLPSHPAFKLSQEVKAPSAPSNLSVLPLPVDYGHQKVGWAPPESELPIKEYRLSWWQISPELARAFELRQRRSSSSTKDGTPLDEDYDGGTAAEMTTLDAETGKKKTLILPSYSTNAELNGLERFQVYMVELYATAESSEGELRGEPAILFLRTNREETTKQQMATTERVPRTSGTTSTTTLLPPPEFVPFEIGVHGTDFADDINGDSGQFMVDLKTPFFEEGRLKSILSWLHHPSCTNTNPMDEGARKPPAPPRFRVLIRSVRCLNQLPPQNFLVNSCVATLENLQFRCEYYVRVEQQESNNNNRADGKYRLISRLTFATLPCEQTPSDVPLHCEKEQQQELPAEAQPLGAPSTSSNALIRPSTTTATEKPIMKASTAIATTATEKAKKNMPEQQSAKNNTKEREEAAEQEEEEEEEWLPIEEVTNGETEEEIGKQKERSRSSDSTESNTKASMVAGHETEKPQLNCLATGIGTAECAWNWPAAIAEQRNNRLIGFRTVLSSTLKGAPSNVTVFKPEQRRIHLIGLSPKAVYRFRLQAVTTHGLGAELVEHFSTVHPSASVAAIKNAVNAKNNQNNNKKNADVDYPSVRIQVGTGDTNSFEELPWSDGDDSATSSASASTTCWSSRQCIVVVISLLAFALFL